MEFRDYYDILGVDRNAPKEAIKRAYRRLARKFHPDVSDDALAEERFKEVGEAYAVLSDVEKRAAYDQFGPDWRDGQQFTPPPGWDDQFRTAGMDNPSFRDFLASLFGHKGDPSGRGRRARGARRVDQHAILDITLAQLHSGEPIELTLDTVELESHGRLLPRTKRLKVAVPRGFGNGQRFRLKGQAIEGGDLYVELRVKPHPHFTLEGLDICGSASIEPWQAVLGDKITVETLGGPVKLKVPAGSRSGRTLRLKGQGLPGGGDHLVTLSIDVPRKVTPAERRLYAELAALARPAGTSQP